MNQLPHSNPMGRGNTSKLAAIRLFTVLVLLFATSVAPQATWARIGAPTNDNPVLPEQHPYEGMRNIFLQAESAIKAGQLRKAKPLLQQLESYPLRPYLSYLELDGKLTKSKSKAVSKFLNQYPDSRLSEKLRSRWLFTMAKQKQWPTFLKFYEPSSNISLQCYYRQALLATKKHKAAFNGIEDLWLVGHSQPDACDAVFKAWTQSDSFNNTLYWQRTELALEGKKFSLARYLAKQSGDKRSQARVERWERVYKNPKQISQRKYKIKNAHDQALVFMALKRLLRQDLNTFKEQWARYKPELSEPTPLRKNFLSFVARWYSWHYFDDTSYWLQLADPQLKDHELMERRIRLAIYNRQWALVRDWIYALPLTQSSEQVWQYWLIRAQLELINTKAQSVLSAHYATPGPIIDPALLANPLTFHYRFMRHLLDEQLGVLQLKPTPDSKAALIAIKQNLQILAKNRSFYGFMASEILGQPLALNHQSVDIAQPDFNIIMSNPGILAAREWYLLERFQDAQGAWIHATSSMSASEKTLAAKLAHDWGWYHQGIYTAAFSDHKDDLVVRFPLGFFDIVYEETLNQKIYADWTFALIRQESAYRPNAKSPVGALGLMQLMPATAKYVSKKSKERYPGNRAILQPNINVKTGTRYLAYLYDQFKGNLLLATAAYNAGPSRSKSWQFEDEDIPGDIWIETIPIQETRDYVKNIMTYQAIYRWHLGNAPRLSASLARVPSLKKTNSDKVLAASQR